MKKTKGRPIELKVKPMFRDERYPPWFVQWRLKNKGWNPFNYIWRTPIEFKDTFNNFPDPHIVILIIGKKEDAIEWAEKAKKDPEMIDRQNEEEYEKYRKKKEEKKIPKFKSIIIK